MWAAAGAPVRRGGAARQVTSGQELSNAGPLEHHPQGGAGVDVSMRKREGLTERSVIKHQSLVHHLLAASQLPPLVSAVENDGASKPTAIGWRGASSMAGCPHAGPQVQTPQGDAPVRLWTRSCVPLMRTRRPVRALAGGACAPPRRTFTACCWIAVDPASPVAKVFRGWVRRRRYLWLAGLGMRQLCQ